MAASRCVLSSSSSYCSYMISYAKPQFVLNYNLSSPSSSSSSPLGKCRIVGFLPQNRAFHRAEAEVLQKPAAANPPLSSSSSSSSKEFLPKIDKSGRFCSPRAARELALLIIYAACLEGSDPVRLFEKRMNAPREPGFQFDKALLTEYNHMSFGGPPVTAETVEEADELMRNDANQSAIGNLSRSLLLPNFHLLIYSLFTYFYKPCYPVCWFFSSFPLVPSVYTWFRSIFLLLCSVGFTTNNNILRLGLFSRFIFSYSHFMQF
ncbi:hypothetical protein CsSME_00042516 [Camellia sinensis var. sinensis]